MLAYSNLGLVMDGSLPQIGENQSEDLLKLLNCTMESRSGVSCRYEIIQEDRGYGRTQIMKVLQDRGMYYVLIMPNHLFPVQ